MKHLTLTATCFLSSTLSLLGLVVFLTLFACSNPDHATTDGGITDGGATQCAAGLRAVGPACVPIFDECKADEIPVLGGGCKRVGVRECLGGWGLAGPPDWKCKPIGPPAKCLKGWAKVKGGWCEPILPKDKCPAGTMEVIGKTTCQPMGDCGSSTWGKIKSTANTIFVDQSYSGGGSDGSQSKPFVTISAALYKATAGDHIAVAAGTYKENIGIVRKVTLEGLCAQKVAIVGSNSAYPTVQISLWASGAVLRGVTVTRAIFSAAPGLNVRGVSATVDRVAVQGCESSGIQVDSGGALTIRRSLVSGSREVGILLGSSKATLMQTVVRDTRERTSDKLTGIGIQAMVLAGQSRSELVVRDSLVSGNRVVGIFLLSSKAMLERSVVRDTRKRATDSAGGIGVQAMVQTGQGWPELTVRDSLLSGNRTSGLLLLSSKALVERSVVRDTRAQASDKRVGRGIQASVQNGEDRPSELTVRDSLITRNRDVGILVENSKVTVDRTVVRDTREQASDEDFGTGITAQLQDGRSKPSELTVRDSIVSGNRTAGILVQSSKATVDLTVVRDTRARASDGKFGIGVQAGFQAGRSRPSELTIRDSLLARNLNVGIAFWGSSGKISRCVVADTRKDGNAEFGDGVVAGAKSTLHVEEILIERNARAGFLFANSGGSVHRCLIRRNIFAIDLEQGARPTIGKDNKIVDNKENEVTSKDLKIPPSPKL